MKSAIVLLLNVDGLGMFENYLSLLNAKTQMEHVNSEFAFGLDADDRAEQDRHYFLKNLPMLLTKSILKVRFFIYLDFQFINFIVPNPSCLQ